MTTKITEKNISNIANRFIQWQSVITADGSTATSAVAGQGYLIDTTSATHTINLPTSASNGDSIVIKDYAGTFNTNNLTIGRNGHNIQGAANDSLISSNRASVTLVYIDSTKGWVYTKESNVADLQVNSFIEATGGTITTSGDYKIHTFTGDGCFVVSTLGIGPTGGPSNVDYLVVAGGGGSSAGGGGGGGAGGFREGRVLAPSYTASPLVNSAGVPISVTTYPVTVGGGGPGGLVYTGSCYPSGTPGSNSVFSTITSAGGGAGGYGGGGTGGTRIGSNGGSGGGGQSTSGGADVNAGGSGNTPPVSPPQGNAGGPNNLRGAGGGGGATSAGSGGSPTNNLAGVGGNGATTSISASPTTYAGGGGGATYANTGGAGGPGGGGPGGCACTPGTSGTSNTGGGGGSAPGQCGVTGGAGGKGIVIIRYKFQ